jgi:ribulose 1,5-bisphosphate synthetase/thiazole synthase
MYSIPFWLLTEKHMSSFFNSPDIPEINHNTMGDTVQTDVLIVGGGPSGYVALLVSYFLPEPK